MALLQFKHLYGRAGLTLADGELPDHLAVVLEFTAHRRRRPGRAAAARAPRRPGADPARAGGAAVARTRRCCRRSARRCRRCARRTRRRSCGWPARDRRPRRSASTRTARPRSRRPEYIPHPSGAPQELPRERPRDPALGGRPVRQPGDLRRRALLAVQVRQVRLDHPVQPALRAAAAALGQPAVPLRHPVRAARARRRPGDPEVVDRRRGHLRGGLPRGGRRASARSPASARWSGWPS